MSATASDDVGVSKVEFYVNDLLQSTSLSAPFSFNWDTSRVTGGSYTLTAKAYDAANNVQQSGGVVVSVPVSISQSVAVGSGSAVGAVSIGGLPAEGSYNVNLRLTMPAGTTVQSASLAPDFTFNDWLVGVNQDLVVASFVYAPNSPSYLGTGDFLVLNFSNVPAGALSGDFGVTILGVWDGNNNQIQ